MPRSMTLFTSNSLPQQQGFTSVTYSRRLACDSFDCCGGRPAGLEFLTSLPQQPLAQFPCSGSLFVAP